MSVIDASLLIDVLVGLPAGRRWRAWVADNEGLAAPDCAGVELGRYLRRHTVRGHLVGAEAQDRLRAFRALGVEVYPTGPLLEEAFDIRENVSFDDALYLALARRLGESLATTDGSLARAASRFGVAVVSEP